MLTPGSLTNMDHVKTWFYATKQPYWTLFRGDNSDQKSKIYTNTEQDEINDSWKQLEEMIEINSQWGGKFRLFVTDQKKGNIGTQVIIHIPNSMMTQGQQGVAGIGNMLQPYIGEEAIQSRVNEAVDKANLKRDLEDMKAALEDKHAPSVLERIGERLLENEALMQNAIGFINRILGGASPQPAQVGMAGFPRSNSQNSQPIQKDGTNHVEEGDESEYPDYDEAKVISVLDKLYSVFGEDTIPQLERLAEWVVKNPGMAKSMLGQLK